MEWGPGGGAGRGDSAVARPPSPASARTTCGKGRELDGGGGGLPWIGEPRRGARGTAGAAEGASGWVGRSCPPPPSRAGSGRVNCGERETSPATMWPPSAKNENFLKGVPPGGDAGAHSPPLWMFSGDGAQIWTWCISMGTVAVLARQQCPVSSVQTRYDLGRITQAHGGLRGAVQATKCWGSRCPEAGGGFTVRIGLLLLIAMPRGR